jgi:hypothetical protein
VNVPDEIAAASKRMRRRVAFLGLSGLVVFMLVTLLTRTNGAVGVAPGRVIPPFAVPLAIGTLNGDANIATRSNDGHAGRRPACTVRGPQILNVCELYERKPLVLALFVNGGTCPDVLHGFQTLAPAFPGVQFAGVAIKGSRTDLRRLVSSRGLTFPVGYDHDGALASLYKVVDCPQITFVDPGGVAVSRPLLGSTTLATLRSHVSALVGTARAHGWRQPAT